MAVSGKPPLSGSFSLFGQAAMAAGQRLLSLAGLLPLLLLPLMTRGATREPLPALQADAEPLAASVTAAGRSTASASGRSTGSASGRPASGCAAGPAAARRATTGRAV